MDLFADSPFHRPVLNVPNEHKRAITQHLTNGFYVTLSMLQRVRDVFIDEMNLGLAVSPTSKSSLVMANTFIPALPDGSECGDYISLDLGSTNFRVLLSRFKVDGDNEFVVKHYSVPKELRKGESRNLYDFFASCIADFVGTHFPDNSSSDAIPLGFTFSFPSDQKSIDVSLLNTWTKNIDCPDAVGKNAAQLLQEAIDRRKDLNVKTVAIISDTTGTLLNGAYLDANSAIGLIIGSGYNACYIEKVNRIEKWINKDKEYENIEEIIVNMESGGLGDNGVISFVKTKYDVEVDYDSLFPNSYTFEKYVGGHYLGNIVRHVMLDLIRVGVLFDGTVSEKLLDVNAVTATDVSNIEGSKTESRIAANNLAQSLGYNSVNSDDIAIIRYVCAVVSARGALLLSAVLATLIDRIDRPDVTVAIDGSVYKCHPKFHKLMTDYIGVLLTNKCNYKLILAEDGSGKGAALAAAIAIQFRQKCN